MLPQLLQQASALGVLAASSIKGDLDAAKFGKELAVGTPGHFFELAVAGDDHISETTNDDYIEG